MARIVRPIQFDPKRKESRRAKARASQQRRRERQFEFGGEWYLPRFVQRMVREPWDIMIVGEANDNVRKGKRWPHQRDEMRREP